MYLGDAQIKVLRYTMFLQRVNVKVTVFDDDSILNSPELVDEIDYLYDLPAGSNTSITLTGRFSPRSTYVEFCTP